MMRNHLITNSFNALLANWLYSFSALLANWLYADTSLLQYYSKYYIYCSKVTTVCNSFRRCTWTQFEGSNKHGKVSADIIPLALFLTSTFYSVPPYCCLSDK